MNEQYISPQLFSCPEPKPRLDHLSSVLYSGPWAETVLRAQTTVDRYEYRTVIGEKESYFLKDLFVSLVYTGDTSCIHYIAKHVFSPGWAGIIFNIIF